MKKKFQYTYLFFLFLFPSFVFGQTQYDYEHAFVCWDSAGVKTALVAKIFYVVGNPSVIVEKVYVNPVTGLKVVPGTGIVSDHPCGTAAQDTIIVKLDSLIDLTINIENEMTQDPDTCQCLYTLDLENHVYSATNNSPFLTWQYEKVVTRNCGTGNEEISRTPAIQVQTGRTWNYYTENGNNLVDGSGYIDRIRVFFANPSGDLLIDLDPSTVLTTYPGITTSFPSFDATDLTFDASAPGDIELAITTVILYAVNQYSASNNLPSPAYETLIDFVSDGTFRLGFAITHNPAGHYMNIDFTAGNEEFFFSDDGVSLINGLSFSVKFLSNGIVFPTYQTACGVIQTTYTGLMHQLSVDEWTTITVNSTPSPTLLGNLGSTTCTEACTTIDDGCLSICDTVLVQTVPDPTCQFTGYSDQSLITSTSKSFPSNSLNSMSFMVKSGTVTLSVHNGATTTNVTYAQGRIVSFSHPDNCKYLMSGYTVDASSGAAEIVWIY